MTAPLMPKATAVWLVENTTLTFKQIGDFCELHELEIQAIADGDVAANIVGVDPIAAGQLTAEEIARCESDNKATIVAVVSESGIKSAHRKSKKILSPSQRSDKPCAVLWMLKNCPEIIDSQICKLIGTTKPTIASLRKGSHSDMANIRPKNPVAIGLCKEKDLEDALAISKRWVESKNSEKKVKVKKIAKKKPAVKKKAVKKVAKKAAPKKVVAKKVAAKKPAAKKVAVKKVVEKKVAAKKPAAKKVAVKKVAVKKVVEKKVAAKKPAAKKAAVKKVVEKKVVAKKPAAKKAAPKKVAPKKK